MSRVAHVIGNGDQAQLYTPSKGIKIACNQPPMSIPNLFASCIVDFKMSAALTEGSVEIPGDWVLGYRPKIWYDQNNGNFKMRFGHKIKEFYTYLPPYTKLFPDENEGNMYTNFNCGHLAVHYTANRLKPEEIHMYGFDSIFDMNLRSYTDFVLQSDREATNNVRLADRWRPIWNGIFGEFKDIRFVLHHNHDQSKIQLPDNVEVYTHKRG
jgi:hypothetical protein|tara:strand:- start:61 stop:693 length:633 start_codon:yes stop_codon:yes gene_type:complete